MWHLDVERPEVSKEKWGVWHGKFEPEGVLLLFYALKSSHNSFP